jgi:signal transduction histidine kinase
MQKQNPLPVTDRGKYMADTETESKENRFRNPAGENLLERIGPFSEADEAGLRITSIIDIVLTPMLVLDKNLRVVSANPSFHRSFRTTAAATENRSFHDLEDLEWNTPALRELLAVLPRRKEILNVEFRQEFPSQGPRNFLLNAREIPGCDGSAKILLSFEDVTDRANAETYRRAMEKAEQATQAKNEFLASMSHEIRTPMTVILTALEHVLETDLSKEQRKYLEMAMASSHSLLGIIDDILDLSRIEAGKLKFDESPFVLSKMLESVIEIFTPMAQMKGLKLSYDLSSEMPPIVIGDQNRLRQVLVNLLGNAIKFTPRGEITLNVEPAGETGSGEREFISFSVRDTGIGIPLDRQGDVFQSFSQINCPEVREYRGSGLGLAICKRIVEQSGGDIGMESKEGEGSAFFFKMPFGRAPGPGDTRSASERAAAERPEPNRNLRILLLEDEADIRELITMLLKNKGWEVITATSGEEGLFAWEKERFDLILMDLRMPMMDGFEAPAHPGKGRTWSRACSDHRTDRPCHEERLGKVSAVRNGRLSGQTFQERGVSGSD